MKFQYCSSLIYFLVAIAIITTKYQKHYFYYCYLLLPLPLLSYYFATKYFAADTKFLGVVELTTQLLILENILWLPLCRINKFGLNTLPSKIVMIPYTCGLSSAPPILQWWSLFWSLVGARRAPDGAWGCQIYCLWSSSSSLRPGLVLLCPGRWDPATSPSSSYPSISSASPTAKSYPEPHLLCVPPAWPFPISLLQSPIMPHL